MIRVLIADDHAVVRRGLIQILEEASDIEVVGQAESGGEALRLILDNEPDVLVLDINMPGGSGLETLAQVRVAKPKVKTLILSIYPEDQYALRAIKRGALGYLTKDSAPEELVAAVRAAATGRRYITPTLADQLAKHLSGENDQRPHESLSDREYQVMRLMAGGKTVSEIAEDLALSVKTISTYRGRLLEKLGLKTTADIIRYAILMGLVE